MASGSSLAYFNTSKSAGDNSFETIEIDPQYAQGLGFSEGDLVCHYLSSSLHPFDSFRLK
jgi:peroxin-1